MTLIMHYTSLNLFALSVLIIILINIFSCEQTQVDSRKPLGALIFLIGMLLMLDTLVRFLSGMAGNQTRVFSMIAITAYNVLNPVACVLWYTYVQSYINGYRESPRKSFFPMILPVIINTIFSIASLFTEIYFVYDANNVYSRGRYILVLLGICLYLLTYTNIVIFRRRSEMSMKECVTLSIFAILPMTAAVIQVMIPGLAIIWPAATLSILNVFINIQKAQLHTDYLTQLNNRRHLDAYLKARLRARGHQHIGGIMIDVVCFKKINDHYGHDMGDQALRAISQLLRETFRHCDFIARYGGDEFVVLAEARGLAELESMVERLQAHVRAFNARAAYPFKLRLSVGYKMYDEEENISAAQFLKQLDQRMYADKDANAACFHGKPSATH